MLKPIYASKEEIPEGLLEHYTQTADGKWKLQLDGGVKTQEDVDRVKKALEDQRNINEDLTKKLSKLPDDFDADKWEKVKDIDPDNPPGGDPNPDTDKEIQRRVAEQVREKEKDLKQSYSDRETSLKEEYDGKQAALDQKFKESWIKQQMAEKYGFNDPKRLRWMIQDINSGVHPEVKNLLDSIEVSWDNGAPKIVGGDLKDDRGAMEVLENISQKDLAKDYKPAADNSGGGAGNEGGEEGESKDNPYKKGDTWNATKQANIERKDPKKAAKLMREAGLPEKEVEKVLATA